MTGERWHVTSDRWQATGDSTFLQTLAWMMTVLSWRQTRSMAPTADRGRWWSTWPGRRQVGAGKWQEEGGRWQVAGGRWQVAGGRWQAGERHLAHHLLGKVEEAIPPPAAPVHLLAPLLLPLLLLPLLPLLLLPPPAPLLRRWPLQHRPLPLVLCLRHPLSSATSETINSVYPDRAGGPVFTKGWITCNCYCNWRGMELCGPLRPP